MSVMYFLLCYMFITISPVYAAKVVYISYASLGSPDFYLGDEVSFICAATGFSNIQFLSLVFNDSSSTARSGCIYYVGGDNKWGPRDAPLIDDVNGLESPQLTAAYCESVAKAEGFSISVKVTITDAAVRGKFFCRTYDWTNTFSREIFVTSVKVAPTSLTMSEPERVVESARFWVKCESTGADPLSSYKYEILRGSTAVATGGIYTPTKDDRGGITLTCTDTAHANWKGGNTVTSKEVLPKSEPVNLTMSIPEEVVEGEEFEVKCESTGADPVSSYKYEILRGSTAVATGGTYTPTKDDRGGITVTCTDTAHPNWRGGNTELSKEILPKYIDIVTESNIYVKLNPQYTAMELHCSNYVTGNPVPDTFLWVWNGWLREGSDTLILIPRKGGVEETVKCTAENGIGKSVTVSWNITWRSDVTTIPTTAICSKPPIAAIAGGVVGGAAILIIILIISVYCWRNRKDRMKRQAPTDAVTSDYTELADRSAGHEYAAVQPLLPVNRINDAVQIPSSPNSANVPPVTDARNQNFEHANESSRTLNVPNPNLANEEDVYELVS